MAVVRAALSMQHRNWTSVDGGAKKRAYSILQCCSPVDHDTGRCANIQIYQYSQWLRCIRSMLSGPHIHGDTSETLAIAVSKSVSLSLCDQLLCRSSNSAGGRERAEAANASLSLEVRARRTVAVAATLPRTRTVCSTRRSAHVPRCLPRSLSPVAPPPPPTLLPLVIREDGEHPRRHHPRSHGDAE